MSNSSEPQDSTVCINCNLGTAGHYRTDGDERLRCLPGKNGEHRGKFFTVSQPAAAPAPMTPRTKAKINETVKLLLADLEKIGTEADQPTATDEQVRSKIEQLLYTALSWIADDVAAQNEHRVSSDSEAAGVPTVGFISLPPSEPMVAECGVCGAGLAQGQEKCMSCGTGAPTAKERVLVVYPDAFAWNEDEDTWFVERSKLGEGNTESAAWEDAASRLPVAVAGAGSEGEPPSDDPEFLEFETARAHGDALRCEALRASLNARLRRAKKGESDE